MEPSLEDTVRIGWDFSADSDVLFLLEDHLGVEIEPAEMLQAYRVLAPTGEGVLVRDLADALAAQLAAPSTQPSFDSFSADDSQPHSPTEEAPGDFPRAVYPDLAEAMDVAAKKPAVPLLHLHLGKDSASKTASTITDQMPSTNQAEPSAVVLVRAALVAYTRGLCTSQDTLQLSDQLPASSGQGGAFGPTCAASDGDVIELWPEHHCTLLCVGGQTTESNSTLQNTQGASVLEALRNELVCVVGPWQWEEGAARAVCGCQEKVLGPSHSLTDITECDINDTQCDTDTQGSTPQQQGPASTSHTATHSQPNTSRTRVCVPRGELRLGKTLASSDRSVVRLGSVAHMCDGDTHTMEVVAKAYEPDRVCEGVCELLVMARLAGWRGLPGLLGYRRTGAGGLQLFLQPHQQSLHAWATQHRHTHTTQGGTGWLREVMTRFCDVSCLVSELHRACVSHGDLKPHNVLVDSEGQNPVLADWGEALMTRSHTHTTLQICEFRGTEAYQCAEMHTASPQHPVDACAGDVWALGCTLYELITGHVLFPGALSNLRPTMQADPSAPSWLHPEEEHLLDETCGPHTSAVRDLLLAMLRPQHTRVSAHEVVECARDILAKL